MIVGIDVSKDKLDVVILPTKKHKVIKQTRPAIKAFLKSLDQPNLVVFEKCNIKACQKAVPGYTFSLSLRGTVFFPVMIYLEK